VDLFVLQDHADRITGRVDRDLGDLSFERAEARRSFLHRIGR